MARSVLAWELLKMWLQDKEWEADDQAFFGSSPDLSRVYHEVLIKMDNIEKDNCERPRRA